MPRRARLALGPAHVELKLTPRRGPVLVEVNAGRFNGVDFRLLADVCCGYNAYECVLDAYLDEKAWDALPSAPPRELRGSGRLVKLVSTVEGRLARDVEPPELASLVRFEPKPAAASEWAQLTVDNNSGAGYAWLLHSDPAVVERDFQELLRLQPGLLVVEDAEVGGGAS